MIVVCRIELSIKPEQFVLSKLTDRNETLLRRRVIRRHTDNHPVVEQMRGGQVLDARRQADHRHVQMATIQVTDRLRRYLPLHGQANARKLLREGCLYPREQAGINHGRDSEGEFGLHGTLAGPEPGSYLFRFVDQRPRIHQKSCARVGQPHASPVAIEQSNAQTVFEHLDLPTQRRLRDEQPLRRAPKAQILSHGDEVRQLPQLQWIVHVDLPAESLMPERYQQKMT